MRKLLISSAAMCTFAAGMFVYAQSTPVSAQAASVSPGIREAAWFPDGKHIVVTLFDRLWTMTPDGKNAVRLLPAAGFTSERDPVVSPDGKTIAFAGELNGQFDIWTVNVLAGEPVRVTNHEGRHRWPSYAGSTLVFAHRDGMGAWRIEGAIGDPAASEWQPRVSPDGKWVAFVSDRESATGDVDIWVRELKSEGARTIRVTKTAGAEHNPVW